MSAVSNDPLVPLVFEFNRAQAAARLVQERYGTAREGDPGYEELRAEAIRLGGVQDAIACRIAGMVPISREGASVQVRIAREYLDTGAPDPRMAGCFNGIAAWIERSGTAITPAPSAGAQLDIDATLHETTMAATAAWALVSAANETLSENEILDGLNFTVFQTLSRLREIKAWLDALPHDLWQELHHHRDAPTA